MKLWAPLFKIMKNCTMMRAEHSTKYEALCDCRGHTSMTWEGHPVLIWMSLRLGTLFYVADPPGTYTMANMHCHGEQLLFSFGDETVNWDEPLSFKAPLPATQHDHRYRDAHPTVPPHSFWIPQQESIVIKGLKIKPFPSWETTPSLFPTSLY